jgi:hypothetical protein
MVPTQGLTVPPTKGCPRPSDQYRPRYQTVTGTLMARHALAIGGNVVIQPLADEAPHR